MPRTRNGLSTKGYVQSVRIFVESCLREVNGERIALDTASSLLEEPLALPSAGGSAAVRASRLSLLVLLAEDLLEKAMLLGPVRATSRPTVYSGCGVDRTRR